MNQILQGNCLDILPTLTNQSVDLVFIDPPFNIGYNYDVYNDKKSFDDYMTFSFNYGSQLKRILKLNGSLWIMIGDEYAAEIKALFQRRLHLYLQNWVIWHYTFGVACQKKFSRSHTHLFHFTVDKKNYTFNSDDIRIPSDRQLIYDDKRANPLGKLPDDTWLINRVAGTHRDRLGWHSCQMPLELANRIVLVSSNPSDLILDPMSGSGTFLLSAKRLKRNYIGIELSEDYCLKSQERLR